MLRSVRSTRPTTKSPENMGNTQQGGWLLFNPVSIVHYRNIRLFEEGLKGWNIRCILNPRFSWFSDEKNKIAYDHLYFKNDRVPKEAFEGVKAVVVFSAQPRLPSCHLIQEAALRSVPVVAVEEVFQLMLDQGYVNNYYLPVDHLFVGSEYERNGFLGFGADPAVVEATGCPFSYNAPQPSHGRENLIEKLGLPKNKRIAALSLGYLTPSGETPEIRKELLKTISGGLPEGYQLIIKPHPAEQDREFGEFVRNFAPGAKIVDKYTPIAEVLGVTDLLFNRGNSQVIIDALQRKIPVIVVPAGRKTFFHGLLDELIANKKEEIIGALRVIEEKGFSVYNPIFERYLSIAPQASIEKVTSRINGIADKGEMHNPGGRLSEISLFWAFMGYLPQSLKVLSRAAGLSGFEESAADNIRKLISLKAGRDELSFLRRWAGKGYREWLIKSLWIRSSYLTGKRISSEDRQWLCDYPPRMNREYFITYACMLCWCYLRDGMRADCESLLGRIYDEYSFLKYVRNIKIAVERRRGFYADGGYWHMRLSYGVNTALKNLSWERSVDGR